jgi:hypothetical protein
MSTRNGKSVLERLKSVPKQLISLAEAEIAPTTVTSLAEIEICTNNG